ncbi:MAG: MmgE/PrpD family protein [Burkholderiales bacterium]
MARFAATTTWDAIPETIRHEGRRALLNWTGAAVGGSREAAVEHALAALLPLAGPPLASVLGRTERCDALNAAVFNGLASSVLDFDDTHMPTVMHPTVAIAPAALACAESRRLSGRELLQALVLGIEVGCRAGRALGRAHYEAGWHITASAGVFGAAAACGRLLGLDETRMTWALGIAATQASGLIESLGTMARGGHTGFAARNGLAAALLAQAGFTGPVAGIEGKFGFARIASAQPEIDEALRDLGQAWELPQVGYKPYPSGIVTHPVIDACFDLREGGLNAASVTRIEVFASTLALVRCDRAEPVRGLESKLSFQHCAAVALVRGRAGVAEFSDECLRDPAVAALRARVVARVDGTIALDAARVKVTLIDGRVLEANVLHSRGSPDRPLADADIERKVEGLCASAGVPQAAAHLVKSIWALDELADAGQLARLPE